MESEVSAMEQGVGDRMISKAQDVEKFRGGLADTQVIKDVEKEISEGTAELWNHYTNLKEATMNPESKDYIFTNPANSFDIIQQRLSPRRADLMEKGMRRQRMFQENESYAQRYEGILDQLLQADMLKLEAKRNALARALEKVAGDVDLEFNIYDREAAAKKAAGSGTKAKTVYDKYDRADLTEAYSIINQMKAANAPQSDILAGLKEAGFDPNDFTDELEGYFYEDRSDIDNPQGFKHGDFSSGDVVIDEPAKKSFWQRLFGG